MAIKLDKIRETLIQENSFIDYLPYICQDDDFIVLVDGSLGAIWKMDLWACEGAGEHVLESITQQIEGLMSRLMDDKIALQVIYLSQNQDMDSINQYQLLGKEDKALQAFIDDKTNKIAELSRTARVLITLRYFPEWQSKHGLDTIERAYEQNKISMRPLMRIIEEFLKGRQRPYEMLKGEDLAQLLYEILNPKRIKTMPKHRYQETESLREQVLFNEPKANGYGFELDECFMRILSIKDLPRQTMPGMLSQEILEGVRFCVADASHEMMMVINFTIPPLSESMQRLNWHKNFAFMHKDNWLGDKSIESLEKRKDIDETLTRLYRNGERMVHARIHFIVRDFNQQDVQQKGELLLSMCHRLQCEAFIETQIGASLFLTCLPFGFDPYFEQFIKRVRRLSSLNLSDMMPVYGSYRGTVTPAALYLNRRNEIVSLDLFDSQINPHALIVGASGAGKSFFMNDFILQHYRLGSHFFVLDKGDSYKKICDLLNGQYISFDLNNPISINPLACAPTPDNLSFLSAVLSQMASGSDERDRLSREEEGLLGQALRRVYEIKMQDYPTISDLVSVLNDNQFNEQFGVNSLMGPTLALRLTPFSRKGPYGGFFDGPNQLSLKNRFIVFELAQLSAYKDLQLIVLLNIMFLVTHLVNSADLRPLRKYFFIDEAWSLLHVKDTASFITNAFKTFRKYRCCVAAITQEMADLTRQESGLAIIANAAHKIFLRQDPAMVDMLKENLGMRDDILMLLKTLETKKGHFAEAFIQTNDGCGVIRLHATALLYWLANSEAKNNEYLYAYIRNHQVSMMTALTVLAKEHPYGV